MKIGIIGGTGGMGIALATALSKQNEVRIGSRDAERARAAAAKTTGVKGDENGAVAKWCEAAVLAVPFDAVEALKPLAGPLAGKPVISIINPLRVEGEVLQYGLERGSAAEKVASVLGKSRVATAFNNMPSAFFTKPSEQEVDVLVAADSKETFDDAASLVKSIPRLRPLYVGPLTQAQSVERITVVVLNAAKLNGGRRFSVKFVS